MDASVESVKRPSLIDYIVRFQLSGAYPVFFAILCAISGLGNKYVYIPVISILGICVLFSVFFVKDNKVFLTPILMIYYSLGTDKAQAFLDSNGNVLAAFDSDGFMGICILAAIIVIPFIIRFIADGSFALAFKQRSFLIYGILALDITILLGGAFSEHWTPKSLVYGLILVTGLNLFFLVVYSIIEKSDRDIIPYTCHIIVMACLAISAQVAVAAIQAHMQQDLIVFSAFLDRWVIQRGHFCFSWGIPTVIGATCALGIPAAMYMAKNERYPLFYYISAIIFWLVSLVVNTRSAMIVGGLLLLGGAIIVCFSGKNKKINLIFSSVLFVCFTALIAVFCVEATKVGSLSDALYEIYKLFRFDSVNDRIEIFDTGIKDFMSAPVFGVGWDKGALDESLRLENFYSNMYHCLPIQLGASAGVLGLLAFFFHIKDIFIIGFKKFCLDRALILSIPVMILCMSFVDNFFFYLNFQIVYVVFLVLADKQRLTQ